MAGYRSHCRIPAYFRAISLVLGSRQRWGGVSRYVLEALALVPDLSEFCGDFTGCEKLPTSQLRKCFTFPSFDNSHCVAFLSLVTRCNVGWHSAGMPKREDNGIGLELCLLGFL